MQSGVEAQIAVITSRGEGGDRNGKPGRRPQPFGDCGIDAFLDSSTLLSAFCFIGKYPPFMNLVMGSGAGGGVDRTKVVDRTLQYKRAGWTPNKTLEWTARIDPSGSPACMKNHPSGPHASPQKNPELTARMGAVAARIIRVASIAVERIIKKNLKNGGDRA